MTTSEIDNHLLFATNPESSSNIEYGNFIHATKLMSESPLSFDIDNEKSYNAQTHFSKNQVNSEDYPMFEKIGSSDTSISLDTVEKKLSQYHLNEPSGNEFDKNMHNDQIDFFDTLSQNLSLKFTKKPVDLPDDSKVNEQREFIDYTPEIISAHFHEEDSTDTPFKTDNLESPELTYEHSFPESFEKHQLHEDKVKGVCYCPSDRSWTAWWTDQGRNRKKAFKVSLYGYEESRKMAIEYRKKIEEQIPDLRSTRHDRKIKQNNDLEHFVGARSLESSPIQHPNNQQTPTSTYENSPNYKPTKYNLRCVSRSTTKSSGEPPASPLPSKPITRSPNEKDGIEFSPYTSFQYANDQNISSYNLSVKKEDLDSMDYSDNIDSSPSPHSPKPNLLSSPLASPQPTTLDTNLDSHPDLYSYNSSPNSQGIYFNRSRQTVVAFIKTSKGKKYKTFSTRQYETVPAARLMAMKWRESMLQEHKDEEESVVTESPKKINTKNRSYNSPNSKNIIRGISFSSVNKAWCTQWCNSTGVACLKSFSVSKYGAEGAKKKAMEQRQSLELSGQVGSRISGVVFQDNAWKSTWIDSDDEEQTVTFKVGQEGMSYDCARRLAIACRKQKKKLTSLPNQDTRSPALRKAYDFTPQFQTTYSDMDPKIRKLSSPNFNDGHMKVQTPSSKRFRKTPHQTTQMTYKSAHKLDSPHYDEQTSVIQFSPFTLNSASPDLSPYFSDIPRGINYDRTKLSFYISYYNENNKLTTNFFPIRTGYNLAKQMAILFIHELQRKGLKIRYSPSSTQQQSITPTSRMNNSLLSPTSFVLDNANTFLDSTKSDRLFSLSGNVDEFKHKHIPPKGSSYSTNSTKCSSSQDSSNDLPNLSETFAKSDDHHKFEYINSLSHPPPISSFNQSSSTNKSLLHQIKGLKQSDEETHHKVT